MLRPDEVAIYVHDGRIIRLYIEDAINRKDLVESFNNRIASSTGTGSIRYIDKDRTYVFNVNHVAFVEAAN